MEDELNLPILPNIPRQAHIQPSIKHALVYIGSLFDAVYVVIFNKICPFSLQRQHNPMRVEKPP